MRKNRKKTFKVWTSLIVALAMIITMTVPAPVLAADVADGSATTTEEAVMVVAPEQKVPVAYNGPEDNLKKNYKMVLEKDSLVMFDWTNEGVESIELISSDREHFYEMTYGSQPFASCQLVPAGEYDVEVVQKIGRSFEFFYTVEEFDKSALRVIWKVEGEKPTEEIPQIWAGRNCDYHVIYTPDPNGPYADTYLYTVEDNIRMDPGTYDVEGTFRQDIPGFYQFRINVSGLGSLDFTVKVEPRYPVAVHKPSGTPTSITVPMEAGQMNGNAVVLERLAQGKWIKVGEKEFHAGMNEYYAPAVKATNLKAGTQYTFRMRAKLKAEGNRPEILSDPSPAFKLPTAPGRINVKSMKLHHVEVWKTKNEYVPKEWIPGHYEGTTWYPGHYTGGYTIRGKWFTSYRVTVTLKNKVKGIKGININDEYVKGNGKVFTASFTNVGKLKGQKRSFRVRGIGLSNKFVGPYTKYRKLVIK